MLNAFQNRIKGHEIIKGFLKIPINSLLFCKEWQLMTFEFEKTFNELQEDKMGGAFEIDFIRIPTLEKLKKILSLNGSIKIYEFAGTKNRIFAGTLYENIGNFNSALIQIDFNEMGQCYLCVFSKDKNFREIVARNLLDLLSRIR